MVLPYHHRLWPQVYDVLVVVLRLTEGVVAVDVLHVGVGCGAGHIVLVAVAVHGRVTLGVVEELVAVVNLYIVVVVVSRAVVAEVIGRRVGGGQLVSLRSGTKTLFDSRQVIGEERLFILQTVGRAQTVIADILIHARRLVVVKCVDDGLRRGHTAPDGGIDIDDGEAGRQTVLELFAAIA